MPLSSTRDEKPFPFTAFVVPKISSLVSFDRKEVRSFPHLADLILADDGEIGD